MPQTSYVVRQIMTPFVGATDLQTDLARLFALATDWSAAMTDRFDLADVVLALGGQVGAISVVIYRMKPNWDAPRVAVAAYPKPNWRNGARPSGSLAEILLERHRASAMPGTIWRLSELRDDPRFAQTRACQEWALRCDIGEVSLVVLENSDKQFDVMELQFTTAPVRHEVLRPELVATALANGWRLRQAGLVSRLIVEHVRRNRPTALDTHLAILAPGNPYGLSRSEFRVCQLIGTGLKARDIADELGSSEATIRSHMRNIYAKTECSGQVEVMSRLNDAPLRDAAFPVYPLAANA